MSFSFSPRHFCTRDKAYKVQVFRHEFDASQDEHSAALSRQPVTALNDCSKHRTSLSFASLGVSMPGSDKCSG